MDHRCNKIKVAVIGPAGCGKSTTLGALFQGKISEASHGTSGVSVFRLGWEKDVDDSMVQGDFGSLGTESSAGTTEDDERELGLDETVFNVVLQEPLLEMRSDTVLEFVEVPGVNTKLHHDYVREKWDTFDCVMAVLDGKAGVKTEGTVQFLEFIKDNLDCCRKLPVLLICNKIDDCQDEELKEQVMRVRQEVERIFQVEDREKALERMMASGEDLEMTLEERLDAWSPAVFPMSADNAFIYRLIPTLDKEGLEQLSPLIIEKIGQRDVGGFRWRKQSLEKKIEDVYAVASDGEYVKERLESSNFDKLFKALRQFLNGEALQGQVLRSQSETLLAKVRVAKAGFTNDLLSIFDCSVAVGSAVEMAPRVDSLFWKLFWELKAEAFEELSLSPDNITAVSKPVSELLLYANKLHGKIANALKDDSGFIQSKEPIGREMKDLFQRLVSLILEKQKEWVPPRINKKVLEVSDSCEEHWKFDREDQIWKHGSRKIRHQVTHPAGDKPEHWAWSDSLGAWQHLFTLATRKLPEGQNPASFPHVMWENLSPRDWLAIVSSILLLRNNLHFCQECCEEIAALEWIKAHGAMARVEPSKTCAPGSCECEHSLEYYNRALEGVWWNGEFCPDHPALYMRVVHVTNPRKMSDPAHWAHLPFSYCEYLAASKES